MPHDQVAEALAALDEALASAPKRNGEAFSRAVRCLSAYRDEVARTDGRRTMASRQRLVRLNSILSMVMAGHFPLGDPPWDEVRKTRGWLAELIQTTSPVQAPAPP